MYLLVCPVRYTVIEIRLTVILEPNNRLFGYFTVNGYCFLKGKLNAKNRFLLHFYVEIFRKVPFFGQHLKKKFSQIIFWVFLLLFFAKNQEC